MQFYWLLLGALSVWRVTHLLQAEDGPWNVMARLRRRAGDGFLGQLLDCFYCLSLWIAAPFAWALGSGMKEKLLLWLSLSGAAILLERLTTRPEATAPGIYFEDQENHDVLREEQTDDGQSARGAAESTAAGRQRRDSH